MNENKVHKVFRAFGTRLNNFGIRFHKKVNSDENFALKIDIEGNDYLILDQFLSFKNKPILVMVETFDCINGTRFSKFDKLMYKNNFICISRTPLNSFYFLKSSWPFNIH